VYDTQNIYTFECVKLGKQSHDITRKSFVNYKKKDRLAVLKLIRKLNENYEQAVGAVTRDNNDRIVVTKKVNYEPLEEE
jgi:hypothetical protein